MVECLLSDGADVNVNTGTSLGNTALHLTVRIDDFATTEYLLSLGANVNVKHCNGETRLSIMLVRI